MNKLNQWLALAANIGVIAGIIFLGFELRQNNQNLQAEARYNHKESRAQPSMEIAFSPVFAGIQHKVRNLEELSSIERIQYEEFVHATFVTWNWEYDEFSRGRIEIPIEGYRNFLRQAPLLEEIWNSNKGSYSVQFGKFMDLEVLGY